MKRAILALTVVLTAWAAGTALAATPPGFRTLQPPQLVKVEPGVVVEPILSVGDIIPPGDVVSGYQMTGIPDGLGAYKDGKNTIQVLMNHELDPLFPAQPFTPPGVSSRISKLTINRDTLGVIDGEYLFTGLEGFARFCSSTLEVIEGTPWYFTGEETSTDGRATPNPLDSGRGGSSIAMNAETGEWVETRHFGLLQHENVVPVERLSDWVFVTTDDDFRPGMPAYLYAYIADTFEAALSGDPTKGSLHVWRADATFDGSASTNDIQKGETIPGRFVPITQGENVNESTLKTAATLRGAFKFDRLEDVAQAQQRPGRLYFADTGKPPQSLRGRIYQFDIDPSDPTRASLTVLLDGDAGDDIYNPDNLDTSAHSLVFQEDRESAFRDPPFSGGYARVMVYDLKDKTLRTAARVNTSADTTPPRPGQWESSGVINAQTLLGNDWWLLDVQAHNKTPQRQPGITLRPNTAFGEDGQLLAVYIPNS